MWKMRLLGMLVLSAAMFGTEALGASIPPLLDGLIHAQALLRQGDQGQGVRVGVISSGVRNLQVLESRGILSTNVQTYGDTPGPGDEGDWMMQVVHDIAPAASLGFCPARNPGEVVDCARKLVDRFHANIVVDDINPQPVWFYPNRDAIGLYALHDKHPNVFFVTGAGNNNGGFYEGSWAPVAVKLADRHYQAQNFAAGTGNPATPFDTLILPPHATATILLGTNVEPPSNDRCSGDNPTVHLYILKGDGRVLLRKSSPCAVVESKVRNDGDIPEHLRIAVAYRHSPDLPNFALKLVAVSEGLGVSPLSLRYHTAGSAGNSALGPGVVAVAAVDPGSDYHGQFINEAYANRGPQRMDYTLTSSLNSEWKRLSQPMILQQPMLSAPDRTVVAFPGDGGEGVVMRPFLGDSAAGPVVAGVGALLLSAHVPPADLLQDLMDGSLRQISGKWSPRFGYGLVDADRTARVAGVLAGPSGSGSPRLPNWPKSGQVAVAAGSLQEQAVHGDAEALGQLRREAAAGQAGAELSLAIYDHDTGDNGGAARWAWKSAQQGDPAAQSFLGSLFNRGWGVTLDPRAAHAWWLRAARSGFALAMVNAGSAWAAGRGTIADPTLGYALMRAGQMRGFHAPEFDRVMVRVKGELSASQNTKADQLAETFAADPEKIPSPWGVSQ